MATRLVVAREIRVQFSLFTPTYGAVAQRESNSFARKRLEVRFLSAPHRAIAQW